MRRLVSNQNLITLGIESSCDDTSASVICDGKVLSNLIANQEIHKSFGGVVPELASRAHQQNIIPVVNQALSDANIDKNQLNAIAYTRGPGLMGSLLVGSSFSKTVVIKIPSFHLLGSQFLVVTRKLFWLKVISIWKS